MDTILWKSILLDWANSTGFLVQNYENLNDTDIESFFQAFKKRIKSVSIESNDVIQFVEKNYPEFQLKFSENENNNDDEQILIDDYVLVYSLFLHYSCVRYGDPEMQRVCSGMLENNQMIIAKFLECLIKGVNFSRASIMDAIEEAEACDLSNSFLSPLSKSISMFTSIAMPGTPRTKMMNSWNLENRNLKAQLETERYEKGYLEMQVKHSEEKLAKLDLDHKNSVAEIHDLKKYINQLRDDIASPNQLNIDQLTKRLQKELNEKDEELSKCILDANVMKETNGFLNKKIIYMEKQMKLLSNKTLELHDDIEKIKLELDERDKIINYVNNNNKELEEMIKNLQTQSDKNGMDSTSDFLDSSSNEMIPTANSSFSVPENLASAVVDVRLFDQQRQNQELAETVQRLTNELIKLQNEADDLFNLVVDAVQFDSIIPDADKLPKIGSLLTDIIRVKNEYSARVTESNERVQSLSEQKEKLEQDCKLKADTIVGLQCSLETFKKQADDKLQNKERDHKERIDKLVVKINSLVKQLETLESQKLTSEELMSTLKRELECVTANNKKKLSELNEELKSERKLFNASKEQMGVLQSKLNCTESELSETVQSLKRNCAEIHILNDAKIALENKIKDQCEQATVANKELDLHHSAEIEKLQTSCNSATNENNILRLNLNQIQAELHDSQNSYKAIKTKLVESANEIVELKELLKSNEKKITEMDGINKNQNELISRLNEEKTQLVQDNISLGIARAKVEDQIIELNANIIEKNNEHSTSVESFEQLHSEYTRLQTELNDLKIKLSENEKDLSDQQLQNENLLKNIQQTESAIQLADNEIQKLTKLAEEKSMEMEKMAENLQILENTVKDLKHNVEKYEIIEQTLNTKLAQAEIEKANNETKISQLTEEMAKLVETEATLRLVLSTQNELHKASDENQQILSTKLDTLIADIKSKECEIVEAKSEIEKLLSHEMQLQSELSSINNKLKDVSGELLISQEECEKLRREANDERINHEKIIEQTAQQNSDEKIKFVQEFECLTAKCHSTQNDLHNERELLSTQKTEFEKQIHELIEAKSEQQSKMTELTVSLENAIKSSDNLKVENAQALDLHQLEIESLTNKNVKLVDQFQDLTEKYNLLDKRRIENENNLSAKLNETDAKLSTILMQNDELEIKLASITKSLEIVTDTMQQTKAENATISTEKNALITKIIELNRTIDEQRQEMNKLKESFACEQQQITHQNILMKNEKYSLQETLEKLRSDTEQCQQANAKLATELNEIANKNEQCEQENIKLKAELISLQEENKLLINATTNKEQIHSLKTQINQLQKKQNDSNDEWKKEKESLMQDVKICKAKLMKERELSEKSNKDHESKITEIRHEFEEKLEKMKEKMKTLYSEEMSKVKAKHEKELNEHSIEVRRYLDKIAQYEDRFKNYSNQIYSMNEKQLILLKENEIMKSKLRTYENGSTLHVARNSQSILPAKFMDKIRAGTNFTMEDEEGELFDNTYLDELQSGDRISPSGRDSLSLDEIQRRNSMVPPHLRSSYTAQFSDSTPNASDDVFLKHDEEFKTNDDSLMSSQSETRRGTLYKRPGPPTPSKNGGRLSFGGIGAELPRGDILREQNQQASTSSSLITTNKATASKKSTPGKFRSIFSSAKIKEELKENGISNNDLSVTSNPISTSTPRRFGIKTELETFSTMTPILQTQNSLSIKQWQPTPTRRTSKKFTNRRRRSSVHFGKQQMRCKLRREQRIDAFSQCRKMFEEQINKSIVPAKPINATFLVDHQTIDIKPSLSDDDSDIEKSEIDAFHMEINRYRELTNDSESVQFTESNIELCEIDENANFEELLIKKESQHPYDEENLVKIKMENESPPANLANILESPSLAISQNYDYVNNFTPLSSHSAVSSLNTTTATTKTTGSYCGRIYLSQHKIPQLVRYKSQARISQNSNESGHTHSNPSITTRMKSNYNNIMNGWYDLQGVIKYYLIAITIAFIAAILLHVFR